MEKKLCFIVKDIKINGWSVSFKKPLTLILKEEDYYIAELGENYKWFGYGKSITEALEQLLVSIHSTLLLKDFPEEKLTGEARRELSLATELIESFETSDGQ